MQSNKFSQRQLTGLPPGSHCDGQGLYIVKKEPHAGKWVFRFNYLGRARQMGLGRWPDVPLQEAREQSSNARRLVRAGIDPIADRANQRQQQLGRNITFQALAEEKFAVEQNNLKGGGKNGRWLSPLTHHVFPKLGKVHIADIDQNVIQAALSPIWRSKCATASKALNRTRMVFKYAAAKGIAVDLNAVELAKELLGSQNHKVANIAAMPWDKVPAFYQSLSLTDLTQLVLKLTILTGVRPAIARQCRLEQLNGNIWTVPGDAMKGRKNETPDFRIPLSEEAIKVIKAAKAFERGGYIFASLSGKGTISDAIVSRYMRETRGLPYKVHGFRSSLRTWAEHNSDAAYEVKEMLLAHKERNLTARAYIRTDYLDERRLILKNWANFCMKAPDSLWKRATKLESLV